MKYKHLHIFSITFLKGILLLFSSHMVHYDKGVHMSIQLAEGCILLILTYKPSPSPTPNSHNLKSSISPRRNLKSFILDDKV